MLKAPILFIFLRWNGHLHGIDMEHIHPGSTCLIQILRSGEW
jgi:hypothetical protein